MLGANALGHFGELDSNAVESDREGTHVGPRPCPLFIRLVEALRHTGTPIRNTLAGGCRQACGGSLSLVSTIVQSLFRKRVCDSVLDGKEYEGIGVCTDLNLQLTAGDRQMSGMTPKIASRRSGSWREGFSFELATAGWTFR